MLIQIFAKIAKKKNNNVIPEKLIDFSKSKDMP